MLASCTECGVMNDSAVGYCACGGIRVISQPISDAQAEAALWPPSPLIRSRVPGLEDVFLKYENGHLTGSFKDRIMRLTVADAVQAGASGGVVPSSGNAALAASAAGAHAGLPIYAIVPIGTSMERIAPVAARGAMVIEAGTDPSEAYRAADIVADELKLARLYSTFASPLAEWACRMIGVEAARQLGRQPTSIVAPISAGPVLVGAANGVAQETGRLPSLFAVQPAGCCPIAQAFTEGREDVRPWSEPVATSATSIADRLKGYPQDGTYTLRLVRQTGGQAVSVTDEEMQAARGLLLRYDGIDAELSAAAGVAWLMRHRAVLSKPVICVITASGFKQTYRGDIPFTDPPADRRLTAEQICGLVSGHGIEARLNQRRD